MHLLADQLSGPFVDFKKERLFGPKHLDDVRLGDTGFQTHVRPNATPRRASISTFLALVTVLVASLVMTGCAS